MAKALGPPVEKICTGCDNKFVTRTVLSICANCNVPVLIEIAQRNIARAGNKRR